MKNRKNIFMRVVMWFIRLGLILTIGSKIKEEIEKKYPNIMKNAPKHIKFMNRFC